MHQERSQPKDLQDGDQPPSLSPGILYVVSTPIGNPDDITLRALHTLKTVSMIVSEDPPVTQALLAHHHITASVTSYGPRHLEEKIVLLLDRLERGLHIAFVTDCGTPVIYDPGCRLIDAAHDAGILVRSVPGPSALTAAIAVSGYSGDAVLFDGLLPRRRETLKSFLAMHSAERRTMVLFVPFHRVKAVLTIITKIDPTRRLILAQELTKPQEMLLRGTAGKLLRNMRLVQKGAEVTLVLEGAPSAMRHVAKRGCTAHAASRVPATPDLLRSRSERKKR